MMNDASSEAMKTIALACDLRRLGHSSDGLGLGKLLKHFRLASGISLFKVVVHEWRVYAGWRDAIAADVVREIVARYRISHGNDGALCHGIGEAIGKSRGTSD